MLTLFFHQSHTYRLEPQNVTVNAPDVTVNVPDVTVNVTVNSPDVTVNIPERVLQIIELMKENNQITIIELSNKLKVTVRTINRDITQLKEMKKIDRVGSDKTGHWLILNQEDNIPDHENIH